jgi:hypothetical protein
MGFTLAEKGSGMVAASISRRGFLAGAAALSGYAALGWAREEKALIAREINPDAKPPLSVLAISAPSRIRALQCTDIHFFARTSEPGRDRQTIEDLSRLVDHAQPDILLVSGDLWHDNPDGRGKEYMEFAVDKLSQLGVPWLFTWGNHDKLDDYSAGHIFLQDARHSLYAGGQTGGCYTVQLEHKGEPVFEFSCVNSSQEGCDQHTHDWLKALAAGRGDAKRVPAMGVGHIPVKQHHAAWRSADCVGILLETVNHHLERGATVPAWKQACDLRAVIAGHDHVNNYWGTVDGVAFHYGQATGSGGYGGDKVPKGAKLYTINAQSGEISATVCFPDGSTWVPEPGWKTDNVAEVPWDTEKKLEALKEAADKSAA